MQQELGSLGNQAGYSLTSMSNNVAIGSNALATATNNTSADGTVAIGYLALRRLTTGNGNVAIGNKAGEEVEPWSIKSAMPLPKNTYMNAPS